MNLLRGSVAHFLNFLVSDASRCRVGNLVIIWRLVTESSYRRRMQQVKHLHNVLNELWDMEKVTKLCEERVSTTSSCPRINFDAHRTKSGQAHVDAYRLCIRAQCFEFGWSLAAPAAASLSVGACHTELVVELIPAVLRLQQ